jgi:secreted trypsin-like serine protease
MKKFKALTSLLLTLQWAVLVYGQELEPRVMHGSAVQIKELPWAVAIVEVGTYNVIGTGNIISDYWILTAAHLWAEE